MLTKYVINAFFCQKAPLQPIVSLTLADCFNQLGFMDLKELTVGMLWILHLIDAASRCSTANLIEITKKDVAWIFQI